MSNKINTIEESDLHPEEFAQVKVMTLIAKSNLLKERIQRLRYGQKFSNQEDQLYEAETDLAYYQHEINKINVLNGNNINRTHPFQCGRWTE